MKDIDAPKGFFDLWEHLSFAIFAIFDLKRQLKFTWDGLRPSSNMLDISLAMGRFSYQNWSKCSVGTPIFDEFQWLSISLAIF